MAEKVINKYQRSVHRRKWTLDTHIFCRNRKCGRVRRWRIVSHFFFCCVDISVQNVCYIMPTPFCLPAQWHIERHGYWRPVRPFTPCLWRLTFLTITQRTSHWGPPRLSSIRRQLCKWTICTRILHVVSHRILRCASFSSFVLFDCRERSGSHLYFCCRIAPIRIIMVKKGQEELTNGESFCQPRAAEPRTK